LLYKPYSQDNKKAQSKTVLFIFIHHKIIEISTILSFEILIPIVSKSKQQMGLS